MITELYTKSIPLNQKISQEASDLIGKLLERQAFIAETQYLRRTGDLAATLRSKPYTISSTSDQLNILINYPATIRFLDLKRTATGKKKRYYTAIYNRPLFGHIYGKGYSLSNIINVALHSEIRNFFNNLKNVTQRIEL